MVGREKRTGLLPLLPIAKITKILEGTLDPRYPVIIALSGGPLFFPASEKILGLKPVFFPGGICRRLRRGAANRFRQKPKLALSALKDFNSKLEKSRRPGDRAKSPGH